jgi:hypothetical protein
VTKIPQSIFKMPELVAGAEGAPPLRVVREGAGGEPAWESLGRCRAKRVMTHILIELLLRHKLNHKLDVWSKATWSERVGGYILYLIHNVLEDIKAHRLHESIQQVPVISRNDLWIVNPRCQGPSHHPMQHKKMRKQSLNLGMSSWEDNPIIWANWASFTWNLLLLVIHIKILSFLL